LECSFTSALKSKDSRFDVLLKRFGMKNLYALFILFFIGVNLAAQSFTDPNFTAIPIGSGWTNPVGASFTPDGQKLFVWERGGKLYVCNRDGSGNYIKQATPVADISEEVANWDAHGMLGFALDPNFQTNGLIYLLYVVDRHHLLNFGTGSYNPNTTISGQATIGRVTRYQTTTSGSNLVINPASRYILIGESKTTGMPILHHSHGVGTLAFAADGTLLVTIGDAASYEGNDAGSEDGTFYQQALIDGIIRPAENVGAFRAQMINSMSGKLLRIDPQTGNGVPSNPFYSAAEPRAPKSRVWALGIRNSFRIFIKPGTGSTDPAVGDIGEVFLGDVGFASWEEMNICKAPGTNFGWPIYEGNEYTIPLDGVGGITYKDLNVFNQDEPNPLYGTGGCNQQYFYFHQLIKQANVDDNKTIFNPCNSSVVLGSGNRYYHTRPSLEWSHAHPWARLGIFNGTTPTVAMIGSSESGVVGTPFPGQCSVGGTLYTGSTFPAAYNNTYFQADFASAWIKRITLDNADKITRVDNFASGYTEIVCITQNPIDGSLVTVQLGSTTGVKKVQYGGNQPPVAKLSSNVTYGTSPLTVNFTGGNSFDPTPGGSIVSYSWNFGGGSPATSTVANPGNIVFTESSGSPRKFVVKLTVTDNGGATHMDSLIISVNNTPPVVNITSPIKNSLYRPGPDTLYACTATVSDAQHSGAQLKYEWQTTLRHNSHEHREAIDNAVNTNALIQRVGFIGSDVYYWLIELTVTDAAGLSTKDSAKIFPDRSTGGDVTPPLISSVSPLNGATNVSTGTMITATFNEAIDPATVTGTTFQLRDASNNLIPASVSTSSSQITLDPSSSLAGSAIYTATITGGASGVKDVAGNALASNYSWTFTTAAVDNTAPTVASVSPVNGTNGVSTGANIIANFSETINASTVTGTTFQLRDAGNNLVPATVSTSGVQITLDPNSVLAGSAVYTATITGGASGVKDLAGNALVNSYSWSFTTAAVDNIAPTVTSVSPANGTTDVSTGTTVIANFSEALNASTVTGTTFQLRDAANNLLPATINVSSGQITLTPSAALSGSAVYTATITGGASGVKDLAGNALASNYSWSFTTLTITSATPVSIQSFTTRTGVAATTHSLTAVPAGALLVLATTADAVPADCIVSSTPALSWTKRVDAGAVQSDNAEIWTAVYSAGGSITITSNWGGDNSQSSVCYVVLNAEPVLGGAFATAVLQSSPSVTITTTRENSIIFGCTADWKAINGSTRTLRDGATERLYFKDGNFTTYHYTKPAASVAAYTLGVSSPTGQQASTSLLEIRSNAAPANIAPSVTTQPASQTKCAGTNAIFTSAASGTPAPSIQWQESTNGTTWNNITGATNATLSFATSTADNNKQYRAVWTNSVSSVNSNAATLTVNATPSAPTVTVVNNCGNSVLTASGYTGSLLWSTGATTASINVTIPDGSYTVTQTVSGCTSAPGNGTAAPKPIPSVPSVSVVNNCGNSVLTASGFTGSLLWSNGATTASITVTAAGTYTVTQTVNGCESAGGSGTAAPKATPTAPSVTVANNCGNSVLTATGFTGSLLWSNGANTSSITVTTAGTYTVTQTVNGCTSAAGSAVAAPVNSNVAAPTVTVVNNCSNAVLTASDYTGTLLWSNGTTTPSITVTTAGTYTVTQTVSGCTSPPASGVATPISPTIVTPSVSVVNNCGNSVLSASGYTGSLLWSNGATTASITVTAAGTYTVTQTVSGCPSASGSGTAAPKVIPSSPSVSVVNNCGNSVLTASGFTGALLWNTGATTSSINVSTAGTYTVTQTINGCESATGSGVAAPINSNVATPTVSVVNNCTNSVLTASGYTGSLLWSNGATTASITVTAPGTYTVTQNVSGCTSPPGSGTATPLVSTIAVPSVSVVNNCSNSVLTASGYTGSLLWSNNATTESITVTTAGTYTVTQTISGCTGPAGNGVAAPKPIPVLSSGLTATAISGAIFNYTATSATTGTTFTWSRAAVTGISNAAANGTGDISETLINTTASPVNVTYVYSLAANGCTNTQNLVVTVNPASTVNCVIDGSITSSFNSTSIPAGRYIWFNSSLNPGSLGTGTTPVTMLITNSVITFTANSVQYTLNVPNSRIRYDASVTSASTQFINNAWETVIPRSYSGYVFMGGLSYQVLTSLPGRISNIRWTAKVTIDRANTSITWRWGAAVYTSFAPHSGLNIKPKSGSGQNPYNNNNNAGTPENYKSFVVSGAKGSGGTNYTGNFSSTSSATCTETTSQRASGIAALTTNQMSFDRQLPEISLDRLRSQKLKINAIPNPSSSFFILMIKGNLNPVRVRVIDLFGRVVEQYEKINSNSTIQIGSRLTGGAYFVEVIQDDQRKFIKIIKVN
jgi:glucose/arabinose dehydrogenase